MIKPLIKFFPLLLLIVASILSASIKFSFSDVFGESESVKLPVLMYHSVLKDTDYTGKYTITPEKFEEDILYLKQNGYTSVSAKQLVQFVYNNAPLPEKPIMITFDDGMYNNFKYVLPILEKHGFCAIFSVVGSYTDEYTQNNIVNAAYSYMRWCDIAELAASGCAEIGNHSYNFHSTTLGRYGTKKKKGESTLDYINVFFKDTQKMQSEFYSNCNFSPIIYTYPFGSYSKESCRVLEKMGFLVTFSCEEGINTLTHNEDCLYLMRRFNRDGRLSTDEFFRRTKLI